MAVSNINYATKGNMVDMWIEGVRRAGVRNAMVIALDDDTKKNVEEQGFPAFRMEIKARAARGAALRRGRLGWGCLGRSRGPPWGS